MKILAQNTPEPPPVPFIILELDSAEIEAHRKLVLIHAEAGEYRRALPHVERIFQFCSRDPQFLLSAIRVYLETARYEKASESILYGVAQKKFKLEFKILELMAQYRSGFASSALASAKALMDAQPKNLNILTLVGIMESEMRRDIRSPALQTALSIDPDFSPAVFQLGRQLQSQGYFSKAGEIFTRYLKKNPHHTLARRELALCLYQQKQYHDARDQFELTVKLNPLDDLAWYFLGETILSLKTQAHLGQGERKYQREALSCYLKAVDLNPFHADAHFRAGVLLNGNQQFKEAAAHLQKSLKLDNKHVPTLIQLSLAYENLKMVEMAKTYLSQAHELDPTNQVVLFILRRLS